MKLQNMVDNLQQSSNLLTCKDCGCKMVGYPGDDQCSDCAWGGVLGKASAAARKAVEDMHFERTGENKTAGELLRQTLGM